MTSTVGRVPAASVAAMVAMLAALPSSAATGYTDRAAFDAAVAALTGTTAAQDFDGLGDGTLIVSGAFQQGTAFLYDFRVVQIQVRAVVNSASLDTTSRPNYGGTTDAGIFQDGDNFLLSFDEPVNAIGLSITTADAMFAGDIVLVANGAVASLDATGIQSILDDGASEFFVGVVDDELSFAIAEFSTVGGGYFLYTLDDVATATAPDGDTDGVADAADNCLVKANVDQIDSDSDGLGNGCDPDIAPTANDCLVNFGDVAALKAAFLATPADGNWNPDADFTADKEINFGDLAVMKAFFLSPPGPSGIPNLCDGSR